MLRECLLEHRGGLLEHRGGLLEQRGGLLEHRGGLLEHRGGLLEHRGGLLEVRGGLLEQRGGLLEQRGELRLSGAWRPAQHRVQRNEEGRRRFTQQHVERTHGDQRLRERDAIAEHELDRLAHEVEQGSRIAHGPA